ETDDADAQELAAQNAGWAVTFSDEDELPEEDLDAIEQHRWRIAGRRAFPSAYRTDPGMKMRPPTPDELQLLEACLRAVPEFVRKKTRRVEPTTTTVPTSAGEAVLNLSWVGW